MAYFLEYAKTICSNSPIFWDAASKLAKALKTYWAFFCLFKELANDHWNWNLVKPYLLVTIFKQP